MATQRNYVELPGTSYFNTVFGTGDLELIAAASGFKFLVRAVTLAPLPAATVDVLTMKINGGASGTAIYKLLNDGDANGQQIVFDPPLLVDDLYLDKDSGTAGIFGSVYAQKLACGK